MQSTEATQALGVGSRVDHIHFGKGVVVETSAESYIIWFKSLNTGKTVSREFEGLKILAAVEAAEHSGQISLASIEEALETVLERRLNEFQIVPLGAKWNNGSIIMKPGEEGLQPKEIPIETFFHKIVMVRDRLRLIEQKINAHKGLSEAEKLDMQQYVTAIYGSLTTFNVLFKETHHQFKGAAGK